MAWFSQRLMADEQCLSCGFDDLWGQRLELVDCLDSFDLGEQPVHEAEVASGDSHDGSNGCVVADAAVSFVPGCGESSGQDCGEFIRGQLVVFVGETDATVKLG